MNSNTADRRRLRRTRSTRAALLTIAVGVTPLTAACSGGAASATDPGTSPTSSAAVTSSAAPAASASGGSSVYRRAVAYAQCMRGNGVPNFPDPLPNGGFGLDPSVTGGTNGQVSPQYQAAEKACASLSPVGVLTPQQQQHALNQLLKLSACMRAHGLKNFPDPTFGSEGIAVHIVGFDRNSPQFQNAWRACLSQIGAGGGAGGGASGGVG